VFSFVLALHSFVLAITEYITLIKNANKKFVKKWDLVSKFLLSRNPMVRSKFNFDVWFLIYRFCLVSINVACEILFSFARDTCTPTSPLATDCFLVAEAQGRAPTSPGVLRRAPTAVKLVVLPAA
jgi:hypothetical protein